MPFFNRPPHRAKRSAAAAGVIVLAWLALGTATSGATPSAPPTTAKVTTPSTVAAKPTTTTKATTTTKPAAPSTTQAPAKTTAAPATTAKPTTPTTQARAATKAAPPTTAATTTSTSSGNGAGAATAASPITTPGPPALLVEGPVEAVSSPGRLSPMTKLWLIAAAGAVIGLAVAWATAAYWRRTSPARWHPAPTRAPAPARVAVRAAARSITATSAVERVPAPARAAPRVPDLVPSSSGTRWTGDLWDHQRLPT